MIGMIFYKLEKVLHKAIIMGTLALIVIGSAFEGEKILHKVEEVSCIIVEHVVDRAVRRTEKILRTTVEHIT